jgi:hypothetical protein
MGHFMALNHTFPEEINPGVWRQRYGIPIHTTTNFMDYYYTGFDNSDMFFYRQWKTAY